jgi:hypothetical protein
MRAPIVMISKHVGDYWTEKDGLTKDEIIPFGEAKGIVDAVPDAHLEGG